MNKAKSKKGYEGCKYGFGRKWKEHSNVETPKGFKLHELTQIDAMNVTREDWDKY